MLLNVGVYWLVNVCFIVGCLVLVLLLCHCMLDGRCVGIALFVILGASLLDDCGMYRLHADYMCDVMMLSFPFRASITVGMTVPPLRACVDALTLCCRFGVPYRHKLAN